MAKRKADEKMDRKELSLLNRNIQRLAEHFERSEVQNYLDLLGRPKRYIWVNFLAGLSRGVGMLMGAGMIGTLIAGILIGLVAWAIHTLGGLPWIGEEFQKIILYIRDLVTQHR